MYETPVVHASFDARALLGDVYGDGDERGQGSKHEKEDD